MAPAGRGERRAPARFVYVTRFGSHQCGCVLQLGGPRASGRGWSRPETRGGPKEPREAAAGSLSGGELPAGLGRRVPAGRAGSSRLRASNAPGRHGPAALPVTRPSASPRGNHPSGPHPRVTQWLGRSGTRKAAGRGVIQKDAAKKFDFPIQGNEASKIMKKKIEVSVWNSVYKVISRMLEENEKYRLRLKCQKLSSENSDYTR
ncbi:uncharacterized protein C5orf47 homolog [Urocitellus parryii]|uniref:uncharacterized protein C5orf47 homolog n=1 Tax=Urocitellus parryii TaxID=9999 RepID=UPI000E55FA18|nr:uncharacterized protein C5orf47 homolog [Urocitellus parryii]